MAATAAELIANPNLDIDPIAEAAMQGYSSDELAHFRIKHDDLDKLIITIYNFGKKGRAVKKNMRPFITDASFEDSIDATPTFTMVVRDPDWELLNTGALDHVIDVNPGNIARRWYRLTGINVSDDDVTLTFSTRNAVYLSYHKTPIKANRKRITRAQFIKFRLLRAVKKTRIKMYCPQLNDRQKVAKTRFGSETERKESREKGFSSSDKITVKHNPASGAQRKVIEQVIACGLDLHAPGLVIVSAIMAVIEESAASNHPQPPNPPYVGAFQQNPRWGWPATANAYKDAKGYYKAAIPKWKKNPDQDLGKFVQIVQGALEQYNPGYAGQTNKWRDEAEHAYKAHGGGEDIGDGPRSSEFKKKYEFMVGEDDGPRNENYLHALYRLAEEVHWSAYWVRDVLHYMSEEDLFKSKARTRLRRQKDGVEHISFNWDRGKKINEMLVSVRMERWVCPVGTVVVFDEGGPAQGRWLVTNIRRSMFNELGEIVLKKPSNEKLEIANEPDSREPDVGAGGGSGAYTGSIGAGGNLEDIKVGWTPKQIIDRLIPAKAKAHKMTTGLNPAMIQHANTFEHGGTEATTWHKGNGALQYAVDLSNATTNVDAHKDDLAAELIMAFDMPDLAFPRATSGYWASNIVNAYHKGYHFQLIYRTDLGANGGNHYNHVHFGVKKEGPPRAG